MLPVAELATVKAEPVAEEIAKEPLKVGSVASVTLTADPAVKELLAVYVTVAARAAEPPDEYVPPLVCPVVVVKDVALLLAMVKAPLYALGLMPETVITSPTE